MAGGYDLTTGTITLNWSYNDGTFQMRVSGGVVTGYSGICPTTISASDWPTGVTAIGNSVFRECRALVSVAIPNSVTSIGDYAFYACSSLTSLTIPDSVTSIGNNAFCGCSSLTSVTIPDSLTSIGRYAFADCSSLTSIDVSVNNPNYKSSNGLLLSKDGAILIYGCNGDVTIPDSVTSIEIGAFEGCSGLTSVTIPDSVTSIEIEAFEGCSGLTSLTIPDSVTSIESAAFYGCSGLTSLTIPDSVTSIGPSVFFGCSGLTSLTIPDSVTSIEIGAFEGCSGLTSLTIPDSVTSIGDYAFYGCSSLTSLTIGDGVETIGDYAFYGTQSLTELTLPTSVTSVGYHLVGGTDNEITVTVHAPWLLWGQLESHQDGYTTIVVEFYGEQPQFYTLTFDVNGGENLETVTKVVPEGFEVGSLPTPQNGDMLFCGWWTATEGGCRVDANTIIDQDTTLYARWAAGITITLDAAGGSFWDPEYGDTESLDYRVGAGIAIGTIVNNTPRSFGGSMFAGWFTAADGGVEVTAEADFTEDTTLYAHWQAPEPPANDNFADAQELAGEEGTIQASNEYATYEEGEGDHNSSATIWFKWTAPADGSLTVDTFGSGFDTYLAVYTGSGLGALTLAASNDDYGNSESCVNFAVQSGVTYYIMAGGYDLTTGTITLNWSYGDGTFEMIVSDGVVTGYRGICPTTISASDWPTGVTAIGNSAFRECRALVSVAIPNSVTSIGDYAFYACSSLTSLTIPDSVTSIGNNAFCGCSSLTSVTIPDSVTSIESSAFSGCSSLTSVTIPDSVTSIESSAFSGCSSLTSVTIPNSVTSIGDEAFHYCSSLTIVTIPDSVTSIGDYAFCGCSSLTSVTIPDSVMSIGRYVFLGCSGLMSVTIPDSVTSIESSAFSGCSSLTSVTMEGDCPTMGGDVFADVDSSCVVYLPDGNETYEVVDGKWDGMTVRYGTPQYYTLTFDVNGGDSLDTTTKDVISGAAIGSLPTPTMDGYTFLGWFTQADGGEQVTSETVATGDMMLFAHWEEYVAPPEPANDNFADAQELAGEEGTIQASNEYATYEEGEGDHNSSATIWFKWTAPADGSLTVDTFGSGFDTYLAVYTGSGLGALTLAVSNDDYGNSESCVNFAVQSGVTYYIMAGGYSSTTGTITLNWSYGDGTFELIVSDGVVTGYRGICPTTISASDWPTGVTAIGNSAFRECRALVSVAIPNSVTSLGDYAFLYCEGLTSVTIPDSVTSIGDYAFYGCSSLTSVTIPDSVTIIGRCAFERCSGLTSVTIPDSVTSIGDYAFCGCSSLTSVTIPDSVTSIGEWAFYGCSGLADAHGFVIVRGVLYYFDGEETEIVIPNSVTSIGNYAFRGCSGLTSVTIPDSVTSIRYEAFSGCSGLTSVTIPDSVKSIGDYAFSDCSGLTSVTIGSGVTSIREYAFSDCSDLMGVTMEGDCPTMGGDVFADVDSSCVVYLPDGNETYEVVDGKWEGMTVEYYTLAAAGVEVGEKGTVEESVGGYVITAKEGETLTEDDFTFPVAKAAYKIEIAQDGKSATVSLNTPVIGVLAGLEEEAPKDEDDSTGLLVEVADESKIAAKPEVDETKGEELGALPVKTYEGLYYQASWGDSLEGMTSGEKVKATGSSLYLGVIKQKKESGFYKLTVSEK